MTNEALQATPPDHLLRVDCYTKKDYPKEASDQGIVPSSMVLPMPRPGHPIGEVLGNKHSHLSDSLI